MQWLKEPNLQECKQANFSARSTVAAIAVAVSTALALPSTASAFTTYFGEDLNSSGSTPLASTPNASAAEASFLAALVGVGTEDFEGFTTGTSTPLALSFPGAGTATLSGGGGIISSQASGTANGVGRYGTSPTNFWEVAAGGSGNFVVDFSAPVAAFGFYGIDIGDFGGQLQLQLNDPSNTLLTVNNTIGANASTDGSVLFFGLISASATETFTSVEFLTTTGSGDIFAFDDMTVGSLQQTAVPVPAAGVLAAAGFGMLAFIGRRRNKA